MVLKPVEVRLYSLEISLIVEEHGYFSIYYKYYFTNKMVEKWINKEDAKKRVIELYSNLH